MVINCEYNNATALTTVMPKQIAMWELKATNDMQIILLESRPFK